MRKVLAAGLMLAVGIAGVAATANAHDKGHRVCWGKASGGTACARVMQALDVVDTHPNCPRTGCTVVEVRLDRAAIANFGRYFDASTMAPGHIATIYPNKHHNH